MNHNFIHNLLESENQISVLLDDCVLNITNNQIYSLFGDSDYNLKELEICSANNHNKIIYKGIVKKEQELKQIILNLLKIESKIEE